MTREFMESKKFILNSLAFGPFPADSFFQPEKEYEVCFGERWHGLNPNDCWVAIADLISGGLAEVITRVDARHTTPDFVRKTVVVALTELGGKQWEKECRVRWECFIWDEAASADNPGANDRYIFRAINKDLLSTLRERVRSLEHANCFSLSPVLENGVWKCTNWKTFADSYSMSVDIAKTEVFPGSVIALENALFGLAKELSSDFKQLAWPSA